MKYANEKDIYNPPARRIRNLKIGDVIKVKEEEKIKEYQIHAIYPFIAIGNCEGKKRTFTLGELVKAGAEPSGAKSSDAGYSVIFDYD